MSTNYYAYRRIPMGIRRREIMNALDAQEERMRLKETIEQEENPKLLSKEIEAYIEHLSDIHEAVCEKPVHLGSSSIGWQFFWQVYPDGQGGYKYYEPNLESIKVFLYDTKNWVILDEYSKVFTPDEFFEKIKGVLYKRDDLYDGPTYFKDFPQHKNSLTMNFLRSEHKSLDGLRYTTEDFS